jgi:hypothetical protein
MTGRPDAESGIVSDDVHEARHAETEALLPTAISDVETPDLRAKSKAYARPCVQPKYGILHNGIPHIATVFVLGIITCLLTQYAICGSDCFTKREQQPTSSYGHAKREVGAVLAAPWAGSTEVHSFPPTKPTNAYPSLFPSSVGFAGPTPTGAEPAVVETAPAYPLHSGGCYELLRPVSLDGDVLRNGDGSDVKKGKHGNKPKFNLFRTWNNLSPWYSIERGRFGLDSSPTTPDTCQITGLHFLHRHGARYPAGGGTFSIQSLSFQRLIRIRTGGPAAFATKLNKDPQSWNASGNLDFLNKWYANFRTWIVIYYLLSQDI